MALTFIQISDTHIGPTRDFDYYGYRPIETLERLVDHLNGLPERPAFIVHTGDVAQRENPACYLEARPVLERLTVPVYYVCGNHDDADLLRDLLGAPAHGSGRSGMPLDYSFSVDGERFIVLDAHSDAVEDPLGYVAPEQIAWLRGELEAAAGRVTLLLHYPLFPMFNAWFNQRMVIVNGEDVHAALVPARERLRGVFFGHQHRAAQIARDGITYTAGPSTIVQYAWRPWDETPQTDPDSPPAYNVVTCYADRTLTVQYNFQR